MKVFDTSTAATSLVSNRVSPQNLNGNNSTPMPSPEVVSASSDLKSSTSSSRFRPESAKVAINETHDLKERTNEKSVLDKVDSEIKTGGINNHKIKYGLDSDKNIVMQIVDSESNEVIRQIPPEEQVKISKAIERVLEESAKKREQSDEARVDTIA